MTRRINHIVKGGSICAKLLTHIPKVEDKRAYQQEDANGRINHSDGANRRAVREFVAIFRIGRDRRTLTDYYLRHNDASE